jgi:hypothetical protein
MKTPCYDSANLAESKTSSGVQHPVAVSFEVFESIYTVEKQHGAATGFSEKP